VKKTLVYGSLLLSAFAPLLLVISVLYCVRKPSPLGFIWIAGSVAPLLFLVLFMRMARGFIPPSTLAPTRTRRADQQLLGFMSSYLLPIVTAFLGKGVVGWLPTLVLILLLFVVYIRADLVYLNPVLALVGYRLYAVELINGSEVMVLSRSAYLRQSKPLRHLAKLNDYVYVQWRN